ncbi:hypothetical protein NLG97_g3024 [Lecanicillium saksenae]|uniref:Uncharacterized protein n=1 Tax=Lecanicillium saksenae TaxID=468837 RepID=A0ACC1R2J4_9HYPO|nr:hypothetical protein NLG97_g3024 [Lecanicillium saksenae]
MAPLGFTIDYYAILQISEDADDNTIKASYKRLALAKHPDRNRTLDTTAQFQTLQEAYEVLKNTNRRKCFDAELPRIRREAAARNGAASNQQSNYDVHSQTPQSYAYAIYAQEKKLQAVAIDLENLFKDLQSNRQDIDKHRVVLRRIEAKNAEAMRADAERGGWLSFLTMSGYSSSELLERKRAAAVRLSNQRDLEEIIHDLEAKRGPMVAKMHSLNDEIRRAADVKRQLVAAQQRQQAAAASANAEKQRRENMRQKQYEEELKSRQREEQSEKEREKRADHSAPPMGNKFTISSQHANQLVFVRFPFFRRLRIDSTSACIVAGPSTRATSPAFGLIPRLAPMATPIFLHYLLLNVNLVLDSLSLSYSRAEVQARASKAHLWSSACTALALVATR